MVSGYPIGNFREKLLSICDRKNDGFHLTYGPTVFGEFKDLKHFYGKLTDNSFVMTRNSRVYKTRYFISGNYHENEEGKTTVTCQLERSKSDLFWMIFTPVLGSIALDIFLYIKTDIPIEGLLFIDAWLLLSWLWIPVDNYRGRKLLEVFKEEMEIR